MFSNYENMFIYIEIPSGRGKIHFVKIKIDDWKDSDQTNIMDFGIRMGLRI